MLTVLESMGDINQSIETPVQTAIPRDEDKKPGRKVLVVDDDQAMLDSCSEVLEREGFDVIGCGSGEEALKTMRAIGPDILIIDLKMPGMSGEEFLKKAKEVDSQVVAVVVTGYPELSSAVEVMKAGASDFLPKPFGAEELRIVTQRAMEKRELALQVAAGRREKQRMHDNFAAMISHQLKSPAACVKECLDVVRHSFSDRMPEKCTELLDRAAARSQLLLDLMDDWLSLARVESGQLKESDECVDLAEVVEEAVSAAEDGHEGPAADVAIESRAEETSVRGDADALREMVFNLVDNAMRYTPEEGRVEVRTEAAGDEIIVEVEDNGPGIPREEVEVIFEPFHRGKRGRGKQGTGLGLAIVKQIALAHGGRVEVESENGRGTTFAVHLPAEGSGA
ncbi:MAG: ATP-binding protein [Candidatus Brocadiia bacterium]